MFKYNIRTAIKNVFRFKSNTIFSLLGLVIGLASVFVIMAWAIQELQYDRFHKQSESIYMLTTENKDNNGNIITFPETATALAQELKNRIPSIENSFHFSYLYGKKIIENKTNSFEEIGIAADSKMLEVLNFPLLEGSINILDDPNAILITEKLAKKLFPNESPIGKDVIYRKDKTLIVKGIIKDIPENSSIQFSFLVPYQIEMGSPSWKMISDATFIKLASNASVAKTKQIANNIWKENTTDKQYSINLIPITKLRYGVSFSVFNAEHGNFIKLYSFIGIALLILVLASLNYTNLVSAYSIKRAGEVGIRKVNGASSGNILKYFLTESIIDSIIASILAIILSVLFVHLFEAILEVKIASKYLLISYITGAFGSLIFVGIISGLYPALLTSSILPFSSKYVINKYFRHQKKLRNAFVLSQFILSITLTIACLVIILQTNYLNKFDLGFNTHNIVKIYMPPQGAKNFETIKNNLLSNPNVEHVSFASVSPGNLSSFFSSDNWRWNGLKEGSTASIYRLVVDHSYLDVFQIPLIKGNFFSASKTDNNKVIINEKLAHLLGFSDPIGKILWQSENKFEIIGVVKDFHFQNLSNNIQPLLFAYSDSKNRMYIKLNHNTEQGLNSIKKQFTQFYDQPFSYSFVDDELKGLYVNESKISIGIIVFTILTIILSCIGLIGLVSFNAELKTKEIGIRKVCGAKITEVVVFLNKDIAKWFLVGFIISCCLSRYIMTKWLENFAFKISLTWWIFISGAIIILIITTLTVTWLTWKAARLNPVDTLKYE
jgi:putative ABC transport system permease protein